MSISIEEKLNRMKDELALFAHELNRAGLHGCAQLAQNAVVAVDEVIDKMEVTSLAKWPPRWLRDQQEWVEVE